MTVLKEKSMVWALKKGKVDAFDFLYFAYHKRLFAFIFKFLKNWHDSEDLVQKIFVVIWEKKENIDPEKSFNNYIFTIARNEVFDILKKKVLTEYYDDYIQNIVSQNDEEVDTKKIVEIIFSLIENLPERRRQIFLMNKEKGMTYKQIALELSISENTVDTQIRHSLNYLRKELPKYLKSLILILFNIFS